MNNILSSVANITGANVPSQQSLALAERVDIHKSCKSLETLLNVLNDYCEAATAIVTLQKRLAKALRETAGSKVTNETASSALNASASIFEVLAEVDAKFVKIADKEYDAISTEVKRWFRKLAKDEKAHDDRIASANAKIKQAGLNFEKKSKKKAADAQDEHSRYIHLISTLGPEITQEKYNHSLQMTQRHATTICSVSACLARIADTEWIRSCESVRRFAPTVGPLGEWRSLCEGGWTKDIPGDLVDLDVKVVDNLKLNTIQERVELEEGPEEEKGFARQAQPPTPHIPTRYQRPDGDPSTPDLERTYPHQYLDTPRGERELTTSTPTSYPSQTQSSSSGNSLTLPQNPRNSTYSGTATNSPQATSAALPPSTSSPRQTSVSPAASPRVYQAEQDHNSTNALNNTLRAPSPISQRPRSNSRDGSPVNDDRDRFFSDPATGSVRSLSAFPAPPAHFPLPPPRARDAPTPVSSRPSISAIKENKEEQTYTAEERLSESPLPLEHDQDRQRETNDMPPITQPQPRKQDNGVDRYQEKRRSNADLDVPQYSLSSTSSDHVMSSTKVPTRSARAHAVLPPENNTDDSRGSRQPQEIFRAREFGVLREESSGSASGRARTFSGSIPIPSTAPIEFPSASVPSQRRGTQVEQTDTGTSTTGSIVAAMKSRYSSASGSRSPPPRVGDLPRLHTSVTEMANRYQSSPSQGSTATPPVAHTPSGSVTEMGDLREQQSPKVKQNTLRPMTKSPPPTSRRTSLPTTPERLDSRLQGGGTPSSPTPSPSSRPLPGPGNQTLRESVDEADERMQWRRVEARHRELRDWEQEVTMREQELERGRARLLALREGLASSSPSANSSEYAGHSTGDPRELMARSQQSDAQVQSRPRRISFRRSRQNSQPQNPQMKQEQLLPPSRPTSRGKIIPSASNPNLRERHQSHHSFSSPPPSVSPNSLSTPAENSSAYLSRSTGSPPPQQEKKGGWMRRLSMPVGGALPFSLDSSKRHANNSNSSTSSTSANATSPNVGVKQLGAGIMGGKGVPVDGRRNSSSVALGFGSRDSQDTRDAYEHSQQQQDQDQDGGRFGNLGLGLGRKSYDASRSASNLNLGFGRSK